MLKSAVTCYHPFFQPLPRTKSSVTVIQRIWVMRKVNQLSLASSCWTLCLIPSASAGAPILLCKAQHRVLPLPIEPQTERNVSWLSSTLSSPRGLAKLMNAFSRTLQVHLPFCSCLSLRSTMAMPDCQRLRHRRILLDSELSCPLACMFHVRKRHSALFRSSLCSRQAHPSPFNNRPAHDAGKVAHLLRSQQM